MSFPKCIIGSGWTLGAQFMKRWGHDRHPLRVGATTALPRGFTVGASGELRWSGYKNNWFPHTAGEPREGPHLVLAPLGPQPGPRLEGLQPAALPGARGARHQRPVLRLRAHRRGAPVRAGVLTAPRSSEPCGRSGFERPPSSFGVESSWIESPATALASLPPLPVRLGPPEYSYRFGLGQELPS